MLILLSTSFALAFSFRHARTNFGEAYPLGVLTFETETRLWSVNSPSVLPRLIEHVLGS